MEKSKITPDQLQLLFEQKIEEIIQLNRQHNPSLIGTCFERYATYNGLMAGERALRRAAHQYAEQYQMGVTEVYEIIRRAFKSISNKYNGNNDDELSDFSWSELDNNKHMKVIPPIREGFEDNDNDEQDV